MKVKKLTFLLLLMIGLVTAQAQTTKKVLVEKFTSSNCGNCPDGTAILKGITDTATNVVWVSVHAGWITDPMGFPTIDSIAGAFTSGAPTANIDRVNFGNSSQVATFRQNWLGHIQTQKSQAPMVDVALEANYDDAAKTGALTVKTTFEALPSASDLRVNIYIVEDSVTGSGSQWDQANYFNSTSGHPFFGLGNPVVGYAHRHVVRQVLTYAWGDNTVLPMSPMIGTTYQKTYNFSLPNDYNPDKVSFVVFVSNHDANVNQRSILNTNVFDLKDATVTSTQPITTLDFAATLTPNPTALGYVNVNIENTKSQDMTVRILNVMGQIVKEERHYINKGVTGLQISTQDLVQGQYFVTLTNNQRQQVVRKLIILE